MAEQTITMEGVDEGFCEGLLIVFFFSKLCNLMDIISADHFTGSHLVMAQLFENNHGAIEGNKIDILIDIKNINTYKFCIHEPIRTKQISSYNSTAYSLFHSKSWWLISSGGATGEHLPPKYFLAPPSPPPSLPPHNFKCVKN